jgi:sn-glycerol 3-phosphate transport system substrate-binding protein
MKRTVYLLLVVSLVTSLVATACGGTPTPTGPTTIAFWHAMGGTNGEAINTMTKAFNDSQTKCIVEPSFQGSYDEELNKLKAGLQTKDVPAVVQLYDLATRLMVDLGMSAPMQDFIDKEKYSIADYEPNILAYYTVDNKLYSMPFNTSNPIIYYNKDMFKAAGLDPNKPPRTFDEVQQFAKKLTKKDASGKVTQYGVSLAIYGWFFEQLLAVQGGIYANNGNGRDARATAAAFNSAEGIKILTWWKALADDGSLGNFGRATADTQKAFDAMQTAMIIESTAGLRARLTAAQGKFELGTGLLPRATEADFTKSGTIIGGGSLWILKDRPAAEQTCAWEFVKHMTSAKQQAFWHIASGYYPVHKRGYDEQSDKDWRAQYPQFQTAIDQLWMAPNIRATQGGLIGVMPTARATIEGAIEEVLAAKATPKEALDKAATSVTTAILDYNKTVPSK